jgi:hypothetical protein
VSRSAAFVVPFDDSAVFQVGPFWPGDRIRAISFFVSNADEDVFEFRLGWTTSFGPATTATVLRSVPLLRFPSIAESFFSIARAIVLPCNTPCTIPLSLECDALSWIIGDIRHVAEFSLDGLLANVTTDLARRDVISRFIWPRRRIEVQL